MPTYYQFRVELEEVQPPVWRRFLLHHEATFEDLHNAIQVACGWTDSHLFEFFAARAWHDSIAGIPDPDGFDDRPVDDARTKPLAAWFGDHDQCLYVYDYGDEWRHVVRLEDREVVESRSFVRKLIAGGRAFPPEDCGGIDGYEECVAAASGNPRQQDEEEDIDLLTWLGDWKPERFDFAATARKFNAARRRRGSPATKWTGSGSSGTGNARGRPVHRFDDPLAKEVYDRLANAALEATALTPEVDRLIVDHALTTAQTTRLLQRIDTVTQGPYVEYRYLRMYLMTLEDTLEALHTLARRSSEHALRAYAHFLRRMPQAGSRVNDETQISDFCEQLFADATRTMAGVPAGRPERIELLLAAVDAWIEDDCERLGFVPTLLPKLKLGKRDGRRLLGELAGRAIPSSASRAEEWRRLLADLEQGLHRA